MAGRSRIENLGDYNDVRIALQEVGGSKDVLFKAIGDAAVDKAYPEIFREGAITGGIVVGSIIGVTAGIVGIVSKIYRYVKDKHTAEESERILHEEFDRMVEDVLAEDFTGGGTIKEE